MKILKINALTALLCGAIVTVQAQTNFTGNWSRNADRSAAGDLSPNSIPISLEIHQDANIMEIRSVVKDRKGDLHPLNDTLKMDGSVKTIIDSQAHSKRQTSVTWSADKSHFTYKITVTSTDGTVIQDWKEVYSLTNDGSGLVINVDLTVNKIAYALKEVFDKA